MIFTQGGRKEGLFMFNIPCSMSMLYCMKLCHYLRNIVNTNNVYYYENDCITGNNNIYNYTSTQSKINHTHIQSIKTTKLKNGQ